MKILLTGVTGYIGKRLLTVLAEKGYDVVCAVRDLNRFQSIESQPENISAVEVDFLDAGTMSRIPPDIDAAYYLIHSMSSSVHYDKLELASAINFRKAMEKSSVKHVIYLSGIVNEKSLSKHLASRKAVEAELAKGKYHLTTLRAGIIIGSGSASFEIIRDLVEKLPVMIAPKWLNTKCQPIAVRDVINCLEKTLFLEPAYDKNFDIGGPDVISYKEMLLGYAKARGLKRKIFVVPVMTPKLSSYWLHFITSTSFKLATALVSSMKVEVICRNDEINRLLGIAPVGYQEAIRRTIGAVDSHQITSSWKDSLVSGRFDSNISIFLQVPEYGIFKDQRSKQVVDAEKCLDRIWKIGGETGWYYANWLWKLRGFAEMKLPGEAWLEFRISDSKLYQTATFRPKGLAGRLYWFSVYPFHALIFKGLISKLAG